MTPRRKRPAVHCLNALSGAPWAITEDGMRLLLEIASRENLADRTIEALEAERGAPLNHAHAVTVRDGVATIPVDGPLFRRADMFTQMSGATSYDTLAGDLTAALADPEVRAVLLAVNSPGGEITGLFELGQMIHGARGTNGGGKPITAYVEGLGASAAYLIASAADEVVASETGILGSIGAVMTVRDTRAKDEKAGIRTAEIVSSQSPRKRLDPMEDEGRAELQTIVDHMGAVFVAAVAKHRGVSEATVLANFGRGGVMVGPAAVGAGLADRVSTYEALHAELAARATGGVVARILSAPRPRAAATSTTPPMATDTQPPATSADADAAALAAAEPQREPAEPAAVEATPDAPADPAMEAAHRAAQMVADVAERYPGAVLAFRAQGAERERARILGIQALGGDAATLAACVADPACTREQAALRLVEAGALTRGARLNGLRSDDASFTHPAPLAEDGVAAPGGPDATAQRVLATFAAVSPARRLPPSR